MICELGIKLHLMPCVPTGIFMLLQLLPLLFKKLQSLHYSLCL